VWAWQEWGKATKIIKELSRAQPLLAVPSHKWDAAMHILELPSITCLTEDLVIGKSNKTEYIVGVSDRKMMVMP